MEDQVFAEQAEFVFMELLESTIVDVASEAHRAARLNLDPRLNTDEEQEYHLSTQARVSVGDSGTTISKKSKHGMVDIFGQTHPAVANEIFECMSCNRKIMAGRFAPHLEKCMGKGRRARSKATSDTKTGFQGKAQMPEKEAIGKTSVKRGVSVDQNAYGNGPDMNGETFDDCEQEVNKKVKEKAAKKVQKKALRKLSRKSARQS